MMAGEAEHGVAPVPFTPVWVELKEEAIQAVKKMMLYAALILMLAKAVLFIRMTRKQGL